MTDLKTIKIEVRKDGKVANTPTAKFVMNSLKRPSKELSYADFMEAMATYLVFGGRFLLYKTKGILSRDIYIYSPNSFVIRREDDGIYIKSIDLGGNEITGDELKQYHLVKTFDPKDCIAGYGNGYSKIKPLAMVGDMLNYLMEHNNSLLKNGGRATGVFSVPETAGRDEVEEIKNSMKSETGSNNAGNVWFLRGDMKFTPFNTNPKDLDWVQGMIELQKIICRVLGVPEALIMAENSSYNNLEGFKKKVYQDTVIPFANKLCEELTELFRDDLGEGEEIVVNTANIKALQVDVGKEIEQFAKALDGKISINNFIKFINNSFELAIPPVPGEEGEKILVSSNMMFLDEIGGTVVEEKPTIESEDNNFTY